jgi:hypothetical protein
MQTRIRSLALVTGSVAATAVVLTMLQPDLGFAAGSSPAGTVDGFHATQCSTTRIARAGKLVATCRSNGRLPNNIIAKAPDSSRLGGKLPSAYVLGSKVSTRTFSCGGSTMTPDSDAVVYVTEATLVESHDGVFRCNVALPDGAVITKATAAVHDSDTVGTITCAMARNRVDVPTFNPDAVAQLGTAIAGSNNTVLSTSTISNGLVNNAKYVYRLSCAMNGGVDSADSLGVYGGTVRYTVSAAKG